MSAFVDASVIVAIVTRESDAELQAARINAVEGQIHVSAIVRYEAAISIARKKAPPATRLSAEAIAEATRSVAAFIQEIGAIDLALAGDIAAAAIEICGRYGKVVGHPAKLNMGDCFAYACARSKSAPLLYKGGDFAHTDIPTD